MFSQFASTPVHKTPPPSFSHRQRAKRWGAKNQIHVCGHTKKNGFPMCARVLRYPPLFQSAVPACVCVCSEIISVWTDVAFTSNIKHTHLHITEQHQTRRTYTSQRTQKKYTSLVDHTICFSATPRQRRRTARVILTQRTHRKAKAEKSKFRSSSIYSFITVRLYLVREAFTTTGADGP